MIITIAIVMISEIWKRYRYKQTLSNTQNIEKIKLKSHYVYGNYSIENKNIFDMNTDSFIMYSQINGNAIVFGDPVGDKKSSKELIWDFKEMTDLKNIRPIFLYLGYKNLKTYDDIGLDIASFGVDANVNLKYFNENIDSLKDIKNLSSNIVEDGYTIEFIDKEEFIKNKKFISFIDYQWEQDFSNLKNKMFDVSPNCADKFIIVKKDNFISGYAYLLLSKDKYESFVSNIRYTSDCNKEMFKFIIYNSMIWAKNNDYKWFNLGLTPKLNSNEKTILNDDFIKKAKIFVFAEYFKYDMNELIKFKTQFNPIWKNKYIAFHIDKYFIQFLNNFFYIYS
jgi:phosphatidylglycerol lysyltransferase